MASNGASSTSRRSVGGPRQENPASSSMPCIVHAIDLTDGIALKCFCGVYAIMYISRTISNPNRLFLGCSFYKGRQPHCKFFVWVDEHLAKIGNTECSSDGRDLGDKNIEGVKEDDWKLGMDHRIAVLEMKMVALEKKKTPYTWCIGIVVCAICFAFYVCNA